MAIYCTQCGASLPDDAVFCNRCGKRQSEQFPVGSIPDSEGKVRTTATDRSKPSSNLIESVTIGQPKKGRMFPLVLLCVVVVLIAALIAGGIGVHLYIDQQNASALQLQRMPLANTTVQKFCEFLVQKDYESVYSMLEPGSWSNLPDFRLYMEKNIYTLGQHNFPPGFLHLIKCSANIQQGGDWGTLDVDGEFDFDDASSSYFFLVLSWNENTHRFDMEVPKDKFVYT